MSTVSPKIQRRRFRSNWERRISSGGGAKFSMGCYGESLPICRHTQKCSVILDSRGCVRFDILIKATLTLGRRNKRRDDGLWPTGQLIATQYQEADVQEDAVCPCRDSFEPTAWNSAYFSRLWCHWQRIPPFGETAGRLGLIIDNVREFVAHDPGPPAETVSFIMSGLTSSESNGWND